MTVGGVSDAPPGHWREAPGLERLLEVRVVLHLVDDALRLLEEVLQLPVRRLPVHRGQHLGGQKGGGLRRREKDWGCGVTSLPNNASPQYFIRSEYRDPRKGEYFVKEYYDLHLRLMSFAPSDGGVLYSYTKKNPEPPRGYII